MKRMIWLTPLLLALLVTLGCAKQADLPEEEVFDLNSLYSVVYDVVSDEHKDGIEKWLEEARASETAIHLSSYTNDQEQYGYKYVLAKGFKAFEVTFLYETGTNDGKGKLHIVPIAGGTQDEALIQIRYDTRYIVGTILSDQSISPTTSSPDED